MSIAEAETSFSDWAKLAILLFLFDERESSLSKVVKVHDVFSEHSREHLPRGAHDTPSFLVLIFVREGTVDAEGGFIFVVSLLESVAAAAFENLPGLVPEHTATAVVPWH